MELIKKVHKHPWVVAGLFLLWAGHMINIFIWTKQDVGYLTYDAHRHYMFSLRIFEEYARPSWDTFLRCFSLTTRYPPLVGMVTAPGYFLFGAGQDAAVMINTALFLALLIIATFKIGEYLSGARVGFLASFLVTMYPVVFNQAKIYMLDLPLTAAVAISFYWLLKSDDFHNLKYSAALGLALGLGMLIKLNFALFLAGPYVYVAVRGWLRARCETGVGKGRKYAAGLLLSLLVAAFVTAPYWLNLHYQIKDFIGYTLGRYMSFPKALAYDGVLATWPTAAEGGFFVSRIRAVLWYGWGFLNWQISFPLFLFFAAGLYLFIKSGTRDKGLLFTWMITSVLFVSFMVYGIGFNMEVSAVRFTMPMLPAAALITALGIFHISSRKIRRAAIASLVSLCLFQGFFISYPLNEKFGLKKWALSVNVPPALLRYQLFPESIILFNPGAWAVSGSETGSHPRDMRSRIHACQDVFNKISLLSRGEASTATIIPDDTGLWHLEALALRAHSPIRFYCDWSRLRIDLKYQHVPIPGLIEKSDFIVEKAGGWQAEAYMEAIVQEARDAFKQKENLFILVHAVAWPDGGEVLIYQKKDKAIA